VFPRTLLLAREAIAAGPTAQVLVPANLLRASGLVEAFDEHAEPCEAPAVPAVAAHTVAHSPAHSHAHAHGPGHGSHAGHRH
jgi:zinc/manganese transport system ATP-binding protein